MSCGLHNVEADGGFEARVDGEEFRRRREPLGLSGGQMYLGLRWWGWVGGCALLRFIGFKEARRGGRGASGGGGIWVADAGGAVLGALATAGGGVEAAEEGDGTSRADRIVSRWRRLISVRSLSAEVRIYVPPELASAVVRASPMASTIDMVGCGACRWRSWSLASVALIAVLERLRILHRVSLVQRQWAWRAFPGNIGVLGGVVQNGHCWRRAVRTLDGGGSFCPLDRFRFDRLLGLGGGGGSRASLAALYFGFTCSVRVWTLLR